MERKKTRSDPVVRRFADNELFDFTDFSATASLARWREDIGMCLRFYTRLPVTGSAPHQHAIPDFSRASRAVPIAGLIVGLIGAAVLAAATLAGLGPLGASLLAVLALILTTGALHEDGLADCCDAAGGATCERRLEIMRDSRLGSYGVSGLFLALALRAVLLAQITERNGLVAGILVLITVEAVSRSAALLLGYMLEPARKSGASYATGRPTGDAIYHSAVIAAIIAFVFAGSSAQLTVGAVMGMLAAAVAVGFGMVVWAQRMLGGQTGDAIGATQQIATVAMLILAAVSASPLS